jgi:hypothetical protein
MKPITNNCPIDWKIKGPNWTYELSAPANCDPMEIFTQCMEQIWADIESWKLDYIQGQSPGVLKTTDSRYPKLSVLLVLENSQMTSKEEHLVVSTPLALANAGLHNEAARLERKWSLIPEEERLRTILGILGENDSQ